MRVFTIPIAVGFLIGALAAMVAQQTRGSVDLFGASYEGYTGIVLMGAIMGLVGFVIGLMIWLLMRTFKIAQKIDSDK